MVVTKEKCEYTNVEPDFQPLPKYGHLSELDPQFAEMKPSVDAMMDGLWEPSLPLDEFRKLWSADTPSPEGWPREGEEVITSKRKIPVRDGAEIEVKIYQARDKKPGSTLVVRTHGGGWVVGGHNTEHPESLAMAGKTNSVVVSVGYRMAPEFRFPHAPNDCFDALKWAKENAAELGVDPNKIIVAGSSAGAQLATVTAIMARDAGITGIIGQVLAYPVTCHPKFFPSDKYEQGSMRQNHAASIVNPLRLEWFLGEYMPEPTADWRMSPLLAPSLKGLPPALFLVAGYDPLRDEALAYEERMRAEGVSTELHTYQGLPHCFYMFAAHPKALDYYDKIMTFVKKASGQ